MAWGKNQNWKWQLRDRKGRWIEMGRGVKWYSRELGREVSGTVVGQRGKDAIVSLTSEPNDPKTGKPIQKAVKGSDIEVIANKATLGGKPAAAPSAPAGPKATVNKAEAPAAKKYNDAGLTADEQKAVDFQEKKAKQAADKGDLDAADRYESAAAKTRKIGEDRIKNGEGDALEEDDTVDAEETPTTPAKSTKAPTRNADIERDLGLLEQEAEDIAALSDEDEKASALEAAQYDLTNDAGDTVSMRLVAGDDEGSYDVAVEDADGKELGRVPMSEGAGERIDTAKAVRELANGRTPAKKEPSEADSIRQGIKDRQKAKAAPVGETNLKKDDKAPETPEAPKAKSELPPLEDGEELELPIPGVKKQGKRDDKSAQHLKTLEGLGEGDRVTHTNAHDETSTYQKHADGTWDLLDPDDEGDNENPLEEALTSEQVAQRHKRGDLEVSTVADQEEAEKEERYARRLRGDDYMKSNPDPVRRKNNGDEGKSKTEQEQQDANAADKPWSVGEIQGTMRDWFDFAQAVKNGDSRAIETMANRKRTGDEETDIIVNDKGQPVDMTLTYNDDGDPVVRLSNFDDSKDIYGDFEIDASVMPKHLATLIHEAINADDIRAAVTERNGSADRELDKREAEAPKAADQTFVPPTAPLNAQDVLGAIQKISHQRSRKKSDDLTAPGADTPVNIERKGGSVALIKGTDGKSKYQLRDSAGNVVAEVPFGEKNEQGIAEDLVSAASEAHPESYQKTAQPVGTKTTSGLEIDGEGLTEKEQKLRADLTNENRLARRNKSPQEHARISMANDKVLKALEETGKKRLKGDDLPEVTRGSDEGASPTPAEKAETPTKVAPEATNPDASEKTPAMVALIANKDAYPEGTILRDGSKVSGALGSRVTKRGDQWLADGNPPTPADPAGFALPTIQRMPPLDANRFEPSDGTGIKDGDIVKGKDGKQYFVHDASDANSIKVRDTDPAASSKNVSALAPNEIASKANLGAVSTPAETPKNAPEAGKPLLNGEEGYVPVDGRGVKSSKETPKAPEAAPVAPEDALEAAGVQRTEPVTLPGEKFPPTRQQQDIIDAVLAGKNTAVQAKAGTGKTTTLEALAKRVGLQDPNKKIAYIAFNKTVQTEAEGRMPANVEPRTGHSVAFAWATPEMKKRSNDPSAIRRADEIAAYLGIKNTVRTEGAEPLSPKDQAMAATRTVDSYANSAEDNIEASHLPKDIQELGSEAQKAVLDAANKIWEDVQKPQGGLKFTLDHMRKLWALSRPDFTKPGSGLKRPAQLIFMDESQDTPPVLARVMDEQTAQKVVVGDSDQNIYSSFTGSIDYMSQTQKDVELPLTKSWRFGPEVADIGNRFLQLVKSQGRVEGGAKSAIVENMQDADAILVRSNAGMVDEAIKEIEKGRTVGVPKDTKKDLNSMVNSVAYLMGKGDAPSRMHDDLAAYRNWEEVLAEAEKGDATAKKISGLVSRNGLGGLRAVINELVENGGDNLAGVVFNDQPHGRMAEGKTFAASQYLKQAGFKWMAIPGGGVYASGKNKGQPRKTWTAVGTPEERDALVARAAELSGGTAVDVTIATAHKSKGLEWDKVKIGDDFRGPSVNETTGEVEMPKPEELRLAYVATTRAKKELDPGSLGYVFEYTDENGGTPEALETNEENNDPEEDRGVPTSTVADQENSDPATDEDQPTEEPAEVVEEEPTGEEYDPTDGSQPSDWEDAAPQDQPEETAPEPEVAPEAPEEAPTAPEEPEEAPAPEEPSQAPQDVPEGATETPDGTPVANEETVPEADREPEPEPEETVPDPEVVPEPQELPKKETPKPSSAPAPEETTAPEPEEAPTGGTAPPEPDSRPLHPVKAKAANYPDGTIIRDTKTGESIEKTDGKWHVAGYPDTPANPNDVTSPFVYDMPKQADDSFSPFEGIDSVGPGDILVTRKGTQVAVVGKRDGSLVVAPHNQSDEWRKSRPSLAVIPPETVKGVNKFETSAAPKQGGAPATERKRTPFSSNRGNSNVTITDVSGNVISVGDTVRTDMGTGKIVRVRPSDGPSGSAFVEFPDGTIKSFRSNKMRNTAFAEEAAGGDDPSKMEIGTMGEAGDGRAFMVGKGNKPIFKGDVVELADGTTGKVSGFAKGVQSVNIRVEGRASDLRKKASVVDVPGYTAPESAPEDTAPEAPTATPEPEAPAAPDAEAVPEEEPQPAVINDPKETPEEREERIAAATSNSKDPAFLSSWWDTVLKDDLEESDLYAMGAEFQEPLERLFGGQMTRDQGGIATAKAAGIGAFIASKDTTRSPEEREKMRDLQVRITQFVQVQQARAEEDSREAARKSQSGVQRKPDMNTEDENQSLKSDRALKPAPSLTGEELDSYSGIAKDAFQGDFFGNDSKLNVLSEAGRKNGQTHVVQNSKGTEFRQGVKVYTRVGRFLGTVYTVNRTIGGKIMATVRMGQDAPGDGTRKYDIETLMTGGDTPPVWKRDTDLTFSNSESADSMAARMEKAYPGVHFDFGRIRVERAKEYAETMSKLFNKYPQLSASIVSVDTRIPPPEVGRPVAYASTLNHSGLRSTALVFNLTYGDNVRGRMRKGNDIKFFNNVPEGREMEYVMTHEVGHALDYLTGNITDNETYELMKELLPPDVLGKPEKLGKYLFDNGMVSKYSTDPETNGDRVYTVELVAESFADVELNGANAKPVSKLVHAELMRRLDEMSGGQGVLPQSAGLATQSA